MPRERFDDPTTPGLYTQVSWVRPHETPNTGPDGYVQVSTVNESASSLVADLFERAADLVGSIPADGPRQSEIETWLSDYHSHKPELTGWYASHTAETLTELTKTLHKAKRQAFGPSRAERANEAAKTYETAIKDGVNPHKARRDAWASAGYSDDEIAKFEQALAGG
jgi:hypothetical protein